MRRTLELVSPGIRAILGGGVDKGKCVFANVKRQQRSEDGIGERAQRLLKMLVEHYLAQGTPVASKTLATQPGVDVSPATVRSIMAELEARGLVVSPHTSAGKIPTNLGLRFFVDTLLSVQPLGRSSVQMLREGLNPDLAPSRLVELASGLLAEISSMAGVVTLPRKEQVSLRQSRVPAADGESRAGNPRHQRTRRAEPRHPHRSRIQRKRTGASRRTTSIANSPDRRCSTSALRLSKACSATRRTSTG